MLFLSFYFKKIKYPPSFGGLVSANDIKVFDAADGIPVLDESAAFGGEKLIDVLISSNKVFLNNTIYKGKELKVLLLLKTKYAEMKLPGFIFGHGMM